MLKCSVLMILVDVIKILLEIGLIQYNLNLKFKFIHESTSLLIFSVLLKKKITTTTNHEHFVKLKKTHNFS